MLDAATNGAQQGIEVILSIVAILVAFLAVISLTDGLFLWLTTLLGFENIGIQFVLGKIFVPVSWAIGIEWKDCEAVGNVIGTKMIFNEFVAFHKLGEYNDAGEISVS